MWVKMSTKKQFSICLQTAGFTYNIYLFIYL